MMKYLKWILAGVVAVAAVVALVAGFMYIHKTDTYTVKVVAVENALNEIGRSLEGITGVEYVPIEIPQQYQNAVRTPKQRAESTPQPTDPAETPDPEASEQSAEQENNAAPATPVPTQVPRATQPPRATQAPSSNTDGTPQPASTANPTPRPTSTPSATDIPRETAVPADPTPTAEPEDSGGESGGAEEPHVHTWVTETVQSEQGHYEDVPTGDTYTVVDGFDDEGNEITHEEPIMTTIWIVDVPQVTRTYCSVCGAAA